MYCPRCGEQQPSENMRFCSRCGLPMGLVSEVLANGGVLPQLEKLRSNKIFTRKNGIFASICWFLFFVLIMAPFWGIFDVDELSAVSGVIGIFGSLLILLFSLFFLGKPEKVFLNEAQMPQQQGIPQNVSGQNVNQGALPPQQTQSASEFVSTPASGWKAADTGELVQPGSVTEGTTKLLRKDEPENE